MKKISILLVVVVVAFSIGLGIVVLQENLTSSEDINAIATNYEIDYFDKATRTDDKNGVSLFFEEPTTFNTVALKENGDVIREFSF